MAKIIDNPKGFKVIEISRTELVNKLAEYGSLGICDSCNQTDYTGYFVAVLNHWLCPKCYEEWMDNAIYYPEDAPYEKRTFEQYKKLFNL